MQEGSRILVFCSNHKNSKLPSYDPMSWIVGIWVKITFGNFGKGKMFLGCLSDVFDENQIESYGISSILTVDAKPIDLENTASDDSKSLKLKAENCMFVQMLDTDNFDLLGVLPECFKVIETGMDKGKSLLVHCYAGMSRSAAIVIAFLMKVKQMTYNESFQYLIERKPDIGPNIGFERQLKLLEKIGFSDNLLETQSYRHFAMQLAGTGSTLFINDAFLAGISNQSQLQSSLKKYNAIKCRKCRKKVVKPDNLLEHDQPQSQEVRKTNSLYNTTKPCTSIFLIEPEEWMANSVSGCVDGKILCPWCSVKIGVFNWSGASCSCGQWVTPSFQIHCSHIDKEFIRK